MKFRHQEITDSGEGIMEFQKLSTYQLLPRRMFERNRFYLIHEWNITFIIWK